MTSSKITIFALLALLITTNAWWTYQAFDHGVAMTYTKVSLDDHKQALDQVLSIFPVVVSGGESRENIIRTMEAQCGLSDEFEKDGFFWIRKLGLRFDDRGKLLEVQPAWN